MSASAFSLSALVPSEAFLVTKGEPVIGGLRGAIDHYFCPQCMSWMYTQLDSFANVRITMLDNPSAFPPFIESYTSEKLSWATTPAVHSYERFPAPEEYDRLFKEYAAHTISPVSGSAT